MTQLVFGHAGGRGHVAALAAAIALGFGMSALAGSATAQQKAPAKEQAKSKEAAPATQAPAAAAAAAKGQESAWVKLCEKAKFAFKDKEGKDQTQEKNICLTHYERIDGNTGMVLVSAALRQIEGQEKPMFMVMVPLGMAIPPGVQVAVYNKDNWQKAQKNEKIDEASVKPHKIAYTLCHAAGCTAEFEATPELQAELKAGGGLVVLSVAATGRPIFLPMTLNGFETALNGQPTDTAKYSEARKQVMQQIASRQQQLYEEYQKQNQQLNNMQGNTAFGNTPPQGQGQPAAGTTTAPATGSIATPPSKTTSSTQKK